MYNCRCLDSILHAEHKTILEEMRSYYDDLTLSNKTDTAKNEDFPAGANEDSEHEEDEKTDSESKLSLPLGFTLDFNRLFNFSSRTAQIKDSRSLHCFIYCFKKLRLHVLLID